MRSRLHRLSALGQSVWIDYLSRHLLESGKLAQMLEEDAVVGVTSNPTIFQKAIAEGDAYDEQLREVLADEDDLKEVFLKLAVQDVRNACDLFRPVWDGGKGQDTAFYTDSSVGQHGVLEPGIAFLQKPFAADVLTRRVREVLDGAVVTVD